MQCNYSRISKASWEPPQFFKARSNGLFSLKLRALLAN